MDFRKFGVDSYHEWRLVNEENWPKDMLDQLQAMPQWEKFMDNLGEQIKIIANTNFKIMVSPQRRREMMKEAVFTMFDQFAALAHRYYKERHMSEVERIVKDLEYNKQSEYKQHIENLAHDTIETDGNA